MKIKPCPFCNLTKAKVRNETEHLGTTSQVVCSKCGMRGPVFTNNRDAHIWAVQAWNSLDRTTWERLLGKENDVL